MSAHVIIAEPQSAKPAIYMTEDEREAQNVAGRWLVSSLDVIHCTFDDTVAARVYLDTHYPS